MRRLTPPDNFRLELTAVAVFALLVLCMWVWYGLHSGMGYETAFPWNSEATDRGRYYGIDIRRFTSFFYHLAYEAGSTVGYAGSYVPYQIVYALLWLLRGFLVFQIVRMLGDHRGVIAFFAGAFTILHGADSSLNWIGQLNQFGFIFWMLLAFVVLLKAFQFEHRLLVAVPLAVIATQFARICIYSYESPLPLIFGFPVLVLILFLGWSWRRILLLCVFYSLPLVYVWRWLKIRLDPGFEGTYQFSVLRKDWNFLSVLGDWITNVWHSLAFWQWLRTVPESIDWELALVSAGTALVATVALIGMLFSLERWYRSAQAAHPDGHFDVRLLLLGLAMVILSFPVYLLLDGATSHWRTQLLSGPGAGISLGSSLALLALRHGRTRLQVICVGGALIAAICASAIFAGNGSAYKHRLDWEKHKDVVAAMLSKAPRIQNNTVVFLVNHRAEPLIFGHNMWWDYAVRLAFPGRLVTGIYYDKPGQIAAGVKVSFEDSFVVIESDAAVLVSAAQIDQLLVLEALPANGMHVAPSLPAWLEIAPQFRDLYQPYSRIGSWPPDDRALRRFGPIHHE